MSLSLKVKLNWFTSGRIGAIVHEKVAPLDDHYTDREPAGFLDYFADGNERMTPYGKACINGLLSQRFGPDLAERITAETIMNVELSQDNWTNTEWEEMRGYYMADLKEKSDIYTSHAQLMVR